ncbi:ATP-dependent DNA helicase RecG [Curvibacter sp. APW13]|uniref:ATP-dependent DNA helicase RecG n=1 Tax=Curvibacter sp. APW13 TaxID=3077236 RepID=UPI0028E04F8A|nr:ATP-dependent DNA helicase RecG [Curvibacter sp. APW13]MDT8990826.1 ATP-dependent DNA helicase RecG [Curvibacter sp. APW13]
MPRRAAAPADKTPPATALSVTDKALAQLGLTRDIDLALHLPLRYEDETRIVRLADAREGDTVQIEGQVTRCDVQYGGRRQLVVTINDGSDTCVLRFFHFYPSQQKALAVGKRIRARGELKGGFMGWTMLHPHTRPAEGDLPKALTPVYPTVAGLSQTVLRKAILAGLARADLSDTFEPGDLQAFSEAHRLWTLHGALQFLHHPTPDVSLDTLHDHSHPAWQRLKAEELLAQQLSQLQSRRERARLVAPQLIVHVEKEALHERLLKNLPFALTGAQARVTEEIAQDMARHVPMHRLLQGDVGAGKTVVAALSAAVCIDSGWQCALMAPTEILAQQHFRKLLGWLEPLGIRTVWLIGNQKAKERREALQSIASGEAQLVVGTHAMIQDKVQFCNLGLAIIDEQHRFGVAQRLALKRKLEHDGMEPHLLMMTATPIPRTLAMSYYADLDVSTIDELPPGRTPVVTRVLHEARRLDVMERIRAQVAQGRQVYWVCPLIEESEALDLSNATHTHIELVDAMAGVNLPDGSPALVGLLHSRMPADEKKAVMDGFTQGHIGVLVSTTVIEVGVDVPNASLMVIENAQRFGLSQLHQLRGRVGRGAAASACVLLYSTGDAPRLSETARERLKAMADTNDGFEIARRDLEIRGPGEFLGARQSGDAMLRFADLTQDQALLDWARAEAPKMLDRHPQLARKHVERWLGGKAEFLKA